MPIIADKIVSQIMPKIELLIIQKARELVEIEVVSINNKLGERLDKLEDHIDALVEKKVKEALKND